LKPKRGNNSRENQCMDNTIGTLKDHN
jgi:hypothetical protein